MNSGFCVLGQSSTFFFLRHVRVPTCIVADKGITDAEYHVPVMLLWTSEQLGLCCALPLCHCEEWFHLSQGKMICPGRKTWDQHLKCCAHHHVHYSLHNLCEASQFFVRNRWRRTGWFWLPSCSLTFLSEIDLAAVKECWLPWQQEVPCL